MRFLKESVGRKLLMAVSGMCLLLFVVMHMLGNMGFFVGKDMLNTYAGKIHSLGPLLWVFRGFMLLMAGTHIVFALILTVGNWRANPQKYKVKKMLKATFASETMIWTGGLLLLFIIYHLLQFTVRVTPELVIPKWSADGHVGDDVFFMVTNSLRLAPIAAVYLAAMLTLFFHLSHGIQSIFQTFGLNNGKTLPTFTTLGKLLAVVFLIGFGSIPISALAGLLKL